MLWREAEPTMSVPTGTVTFLFTDIEGSTRLWSESRDVMGVAVERHNVRLATYKEVMAARKDFKAFKAP